MPEPLSDAFWKAEAERLAEVMRPWVEEAAKRGAAEGLYALGEMGTSLVLDWNLINDYARAWAVVHTAEVVSAITTTSMKAFTDAFPDWLASGKPLSVLKDKLSKSYEPWRAQMIAVTETTRAFSKGNHVMWGASGVVDGTQWMGGQDDIVCPLCGGLIGDIAQMDGTYKDGSYGPPKHVACRCYERPVVNKELPTISDNVPVTAESMRNAYSDFMKTWTEDEIKTARRYFGGSFTGMNKRLRDQIAESSWGENFQKLYKTLVDKIDAAPRLPSDAKLFRFFESEKTVAQIKDGTLGVGSVFSDRAFMSTSLSKSYDGIKDFTGQNTIVLRINAPKGSKGLFASTKVLNPNHLAEQEFLLAPNSKLEITRIILDDKDRAIIEATLRN